jgi:peroxiredoxin
MEEERPDSVNGHELQEHRPELAGPEMNPPQPERPPTALRILRIALPLSVLLVGILVITQPWSSEQAELTVAKDRRVAPDFTLADAQGANIKLSDYKGKVVLLNFWATWCGPCQVEIPWFEEFENKYKDRGFTVLGVSVDDDGWKAVKPYIAQKRMNYPVLLGNEKVSDLYGGVDSIPTTLMVDRDGKIAATHVGLESKSTYEKEVVKLLGD